MARILYAFYAIIDWLRRNYNFSFLLPLELRQWFQLVLNKDFVVDPDGRWRWVIRACYRCRWRTICDISRFLIRVGIFIVVFFFIFVIVNLFKNGFGNCGQTRFEDSIVSDYSFLFLSLLWFWLWGELAMSTKISYNINCYGYGGGWWIEIGHRVTLWLICTSINLLCCGRH